MTYLRLVAGTRFAVAQAGVAQFVFLVLFSYAFFFEGYTGLTVTIGAIVTLFVLMQATARVDWGAVFARPTGMHIGIIMDGNGRWATRQGRPRVAGHRAGRRRVRRIVEAAPALGIGSSPSSRSPPTTGSGPTRGEVADGALRAYLRAEVVRCCSRGRPAHGDRPARPASSGAPGADSPT